MLGNLQLFLIQMLVLFVGAQAITETLKQTIFKKALVDAKLTPAQQTTDALVRQEQQRKTKVRHLAWIPGTALAILAQINPFQTLTTDTMWGAAQKLMVHWGAPDPLTNIVVGIAYILNFALVGYLAVYGAPLFNDLLNLVTNLRTNIDNVQQVVQAKPGNFPPVAEQMLAEAIMRNSHPPIPFEKAMDQAKAILEAAAAAQQH